MFDNDTNKDSTRFTSIGALIERTLSRLKNDTLCTKKRAVINKRK